jgi:hypothetical protein
VPAPEGPAPAHATSSVVVDARQSELEREQAALEAEERGEVPAEEEDDDRERFDHEYQVGIRAGAGVPFFVGLRYGGGTGTPCDGRGSETFCYWVGSGIVDLDLSVGVTPDLEITSMVRIGMIGVEPTGENNIQVGLGIRSYLSPEERFKFFLGVRAIIDLTQPGAGVPNWPIVDAGVRGEVGLQLDIVRYVGFYLQIGVSILVVRAFGISPDATGGFQIRFP